MQEELESLLIFSCQLVQTWAQVGILRIFCHSVTNQINVLISRKNAPVLVLDIIKQISSSQLCDFYFMLLKRVNVLHANIQYV